MLALKICDKVHWSDSWSRQIGQRLDIRDSTHDLLVFEPHHQRKEVLDVLKDIPANLYELTDVTTTNEDSCELWTDEGHCYRHH